MADQTNAEVSDERLRECPFCGGEPHMRTSSDFTKSSYSVFCRNCFVSSPLELNEQLAIAAWNRRSVTSQASEGAGSRPAWTDAQIESMARELCSFRGETPHAVDRGGVEKWEDYKPLAKAALDESARIYASPVSKRVERLEAALQQIKARTYSDDRGCALAADAVAEISDIASQALGGRS